MRFYPKKEPAIQSMEETLRRLGNRAHSAKVELEPYRGWVVVIFPRPGHNLESDEFEIRSLVDLRPTKANTPKRANPTLAPDLGTSRMDRPKAALEAEYKRRHGKFPPREWKKAFLATYLDNEDAS